MIRITFKQFGRDILYASCVLVQIIGSFDMRGFIVFLFHFWASSKNLFVRFIKFSFSSNIDGTERPPFLTNQMYFES